MHLKLVGGNHLGLGPDLACSHRRRRPGDRGGTRAVGAKAVGRRVSVALFDGDVIGGDADFGGDDLGIGRLVPLPLTFGAHAGDHRSGRMDADFGRIEHGDAKNVAVLGGTGADNFGKERNADAHQLARLAALEGLALCRLFGPQSGIADGVHRLFHGRVVVAAVVFPAKCGVVGELLGLDEVLEAQFSRIHAQLLGQHFDGAFDGEDRFGHPERTAIGHAARRLVGINAIDNQMRRRDVIRTGADVHEPGGPFRRVGAGVKRTVICQNMHPHGGDLAVLGRGQFGRHVIIAGE